MEFIKLNGYSAHARRRSSTGSGAGVSLDQVRNHLLQTVPGLKEMNMELAKQLLHTCSVLPIKVENQVPDIKVT